MSYYYNIMPNQNHTTNLPNMSRPQQQNQYVPSFNYELKQFQPQISYNPDQYDYLTNKRQRLTSDSLLSLSSQIDFSNIENRSSYKNNSMSYSYKNETNLKKSDNNSKKRSSSLDLNKNYDNDTYHEINSNNKKVLLPDLWTDNKKKTPEKIHDFFNGKILNKQISDSNSSLNLIEIKKEYRIKKIWRKVFS